MKKSALIVIVLCLSLCQCQKGVRLSIQEITQTAMLGKWKFQRMTDRYHQTYTNADPCFADDTFEFADDYAILSQGSCVEFADKAPVIQFTWKFVSEDQVDMGGDTVRILQANDTSLIFRRDDPEYLEYHWFRK